MVPFFCVLFPFVIALPLLAQAPTNAALAPGSQPIVHSKAFFVLPNSGTVDNSTRPVAALSTRQKFELFTRQTFSPGFLLLTGAAAGLKQTGNFSPEYGYGGEAYAKRFGATAGDIASASLLTTAVMPSILHQDPRYFRKGSGGTNARLWYAISRVVIGRKDSGRATINASQFAGTAGSVAFGN